MGRIVEVRRFDNAAEAHLARGALVSAGIEADVLDEAVGTALPHVGPVRVRLLIDEDDVRAADEVLARHEAGDAAELDAAFRADESVDAESPPEVAAVTREIEDAEAWARATRAIAACGLVILLFVPFALWRVTHPPAAVAGSPRAQRHLGQARVFLLATFVVYGILVAAISGAF